MQQQSLEALSMKGMLKKAKVTWPRAVAFKPFVIGIKDFKGNYKTHIINLYK